MPLLLPEFALPVSRQLRMDFVFHLVAVHCNIAAFEYKTIAEMVEYHRAEHFEPCGIRNHPYGSHHWDEEKLEEVLEEAEQHDYGFTRGTIGDGLVKEFFWRLPSLADSMKLNIPRKASH